MTGIVDFRTELLDEDGNPITAANPLPVTGGGGGGGGTLSDTVFVDSVGKLFVYRDTGSGTPNAYEIPAWTLYSPVGAVASASSGNAAAGGTGASVPGSADYVGFNSGGNLVGVSSSNPLPVAVGNFPATQDVNVVGGGSALADVLLTDATGALFVARDNGTAVTFFNLNTNSAYTPTGTIAAAGLTDAQLRATPVSVSLAGTTGVLAVQDDASEMLLTRLLNALNSPQGYDKSLQRQRGTVVVETLPTLGNVTTVASVNNLSTIDTLQGRIQVYGANLSAWSDCVRARIT